uniref:Uncharacterized protein n=1 Tax=Accipiter nisus TaxID=211598 RepID=A0A8B9NJU7_9AVES
MSPAEEEKSLPLPERWPRASKFALSACAAAVAELGTTHPDFPRGKGKNRTLHSCVVNCLLKCMERSTPGSAQHYFVISN